MDVSLQSWQDFEMDSPGVKIVIKFLVKYCRWLDSDVVEIDPILRRWRLRIEICPRFEIYVNISDVDNSFVNAI